MTLLDYLENRVTVAPASGEEYDANETREAYIARVTAEGLRVVTPEANQLQIDIDSDDHYGVFLRSAEVVVRNVPGAYGWGVEDHPSRSGAPCRHITLTLPFPVEPWQRIALQAALGSDPVRELLSSIRMMRGDAYPTLFVERGSRTD